MTYVYALLDPVTQAIRYVGKSNNPAARFAQHLAPSAHPPIRKWVAEVGCPGLRIVSAFDQERDAELAEQALIRELFSTGLLLNSKTMLEDLPPIREEFSGFGERCVARRKQLGITQRRLAKCIGMDASCLSRLEAAVISTTSADAAIRIARALDCSVEWLVTGEERELARAAE